MFEISGVKAVTFYGSVDKDKARKDFHNKNDIRLFIGQVDSGVGMNELVVADTALYYSNSHKVLSRKQSEGRLRRKGTKHRVVTYYDLITEGTTDIQVFKKLQLGVSFADYVIDKLRNKEPLSRILGVSQCI